jgi:hypothetical protein
VAREITARTARILRRPWGTPRRVTHPNIASVIPARGKLPFIGPGEFAETAAAATVIVKATWEGVDPFSVTLVGLNEQLTPCGSEGQLKLMVSVSPPIGVAVIVNCVDWPGLRVALDGDAERVYLGVPVP